MKLSAMDNSRAPAWTRDVQLLALVKLVAMANAQHRTVYSAYSLRASSSDAITQGPGGDARDEERPVGCPCSPPRRSS